jgi:hypothetical protein
MPKHFTIFRQVVLGYVLIVGLSIGLITPIAQAEAPLDGLYPESATTIVGGLTQAERAAKIDEFYRVRGNLPLMGHGIDMVRAADKYQIDWRLVAAFAYNESTAGLHECKAKNGIKTYNAFGYGGCTKTFASYAHAIDTVTRNIAGEIPATSKYYKDKSLEQIIDAYNPPRINPKYKTLVLWTMNKIGSMEPVSKEIAVRELAMK